MAAVGPMVGGWPHPIKPAAPILVARRGEGAARQLLGVEAEGRPLRAVAPFRQRARDRLRFELAAESGQILKLVRRVRHRRNNPLDFTGEARGSLRVSCPTRKYVSVDVDLDLIGNVDVGLVA